MRREALEEYIPFHQRSPGTLRAFAKRGALWPLRRYFCERCCDHPGTEEHFMLKRSVNAVGVVASLLPWQHDILQESLLTEQPSSKFYT